MTRSHSGSEAAGSPGTGLASPAATDFLTCTGRLVGLARSMVRSLRWTPAPIKKRMPASMAARELPSILPARVDVSLSMLNALRCSGSAILSALKMSFEAFAPSGFL